MQHKKSEPHSNEINMASFQHQQATYSRRRSYHGAQSGKTIIFVLTAVLVIALIAGAIFLVVRLFGSEKTNPEQDPAQQVQEPEVIPPSQVVEVSPPVQSVVPPVEPEPTPFLKETENTVILNDSFPSEYVIVLDNQTGEILAEKNAAECMIPASMTKVLTLLVAVENIEQTDGTFTMTREIADYCFVNECSVVGYVVGETVPIEELFYGCILCSGADACLALAELAAGTHEAFVDLMNNKLDELGLSETSHFTNCVGVYDTSHYCTATDMAMMLKAALENEKCREVLTTKVYFSAATAEHPEGQTLSNWFVRSAEDQDSGAVKVIGGKRGYVPQSGNCAASYAETEDGYGYICVTGNANSQKQAIYDHAALYKTYCTE